MSTISLYYNQCGADRFERSCPQYMYVANTHCKQLDCCNYIDAQVVGLHDRLIYAAIQHINTLPIMLGTLLFVIVQFSTIYDRV